VYFTYTAPDARLLGGTTSPAPDVLDYTADARLPLVALLTWQRSGERRVDLWTSGAAPVSLSLASTLGPVAPGAALTVRARQADGSWASVPFTRDGDRVRFAAGGLLAYRVTAPGSAVDPAPPL